MKCESILYRKAIKSGCSYTDTARNRNNLKIYISSKCVPQKEVVKYLGVYLDKFLYLHHHIKTQLSKAQKAFFMCKKLFYSKYIDKKVKTICYKTFIKPILLYACPVWFNINGNTMELLRKFERKCLRHCNNQFRSVNTGYQHYVSNVKQYEIYDSQRIDTHIIELTRNHIQRTTSYLDNSQKFGPYFTNCTIIKNSLCENNIPGPEAFILLDQIGYIENNEQIPLIYHVNRKINEKWFDPNKFNNPNAFIMNSIAIHKTPSQMYDQNMKKYWWKTT